MVARGRTGGKVPGGGLEGRCQGEDWTEGTVGEFGLDMYTRLYLKRTTSKGLVG